MANESALRSRVSGWLREAMFFVQPIETGAIVEGVPDLWYSWQDSIGFNKRNGWLELKTVKEMPKKPTTAVFKSMNHPLSNSQINWIDRCNGNGGKADILVGFGRYYFFVPGRHAEKFNEFTETDLRAYMVTKEQLIAKLAPER